MRGSEEGREISRPSIPFRGCGGSSTSRRGSKGCRRVVGIRWRGANDFSRNVGADKGQAVDFLVVVKCPFGA